MKNKMFFKMKKGLIFFVSILLLTYGGANRDRTGDLLVANEALSQLSYSPKAKRL